MKKGKRILVFLLVLACVMGAVIPAHAAGSRQDDQEYTDTLQRDCILAVRADVFDGFTGTVKVSVLDGYGKSTDCELTEENGYACNLKVAEGNYEVRSVSAFTDAVFYEVKRLSSRIRVTCGEIAVCRLVVSDYEIPGEEAEETQTIEQKDQDKEDTMKNQYENVQESTGKKKTSGGRISVLLWLAALTGAGIYWYLRYGKKKRHGR